MRVMCTCCTVGRTRRHVLQFFLAWCHARQWVGPGGDLPTLAETATDSSAPADGPGLCVELELTATLEPGACSLHEVPASGTAAEDDDDQHSTATGSVMPWGTRATTVMSGDAPMSGYGSVAASTFSSNSGPGTVRMRRSVCFRKRRSHTRHVCFACAGVIRAAVAGRRGEHPLHAGRHK